MREERRKEIYTEERLLGLKGKSSSLYYGEELLEKYPTHFNWTELCRRNIFSEEFLEKFKGYIDWNYVDHYRDLTGDPERFSFEMIEKFEEYYVISSRDYCYNSGFTLKFVEKYEWTISWPQYARNGAITLDIINKFKERFTHCKWEILNNDSFLHSEEMLRAHPDLIHNWDKLSSHGKFSKEFYIDNLFKLNSNLIIRNTNLGWNKVRFDDDELDLLVRLNNIKV